MRYPNTVGSTFIERPNRFIAKVTLTMVRQSAT